MRMLKITIFFISCIYAYQSNAQYDSIFASVEGNNVTLWETGAQRPCGALYEMTINLNVHSINWVQIDTSLDANCLCVYDLSVTYGPLEPGDYTVDVFYTLSFEPGEIYDGSTGFTIGGARDKEDGGILSQYQSDCYADVDEHTSAEEFRIYPVPLSDGEDFNIEASVSGRKTILEIYTATGKQVFKRQYHGNSQIQDRFVKEELFPVAGIYIVRLVNDDKVFTRKITVM